MKHSCYIKEIISLRTCPYIYLTEWSGRRQPQNLLDVVRTLLLRSSVPSTFSMETIYNVVQLINRLSSPKLQHQSRNSRLFAQHPRYDHFHTFGCVRFVHLPLLEHHKLSSYFVKSAFLRYAPHQMGFLCYNFFIWKINISFDILLQLYAVSFVLHPVSLL